jgi:molybdopterin-guanine dinucleotide biosynthesis protein
VEEAAVIIDIRGPNGSGKTTLVRRMLDEEATWRRDLVGPVAVLGAGPGETWAVECELGGRRVYALGAYDDAPTGGCDRIRTQDAVTARVRELCQHGDVVFEGVITGTIFGRYAELARDAVDAWMVPYVVLSLAVPLEVCIERVRARRAARGADVGGFKTELVEGKLASIQSALAKFRAAGIDVIEAEPAPGLIGRILSEAETGQAALAL